MADGCNNIVSLVWLLDGDGAVFTSGIVELMRGNLASSRPCTLFSKALLGEKVEFNIFRQEHLTI